MKSIDNLIFEVTFNLMERLAAKGKEQKRCGLSSFTKTCLDLQL